MFVNLSYEIGASVQFLLNKIDAKAISKIENGSYQFETAKALFPMSDIEQKKYLEAAKQSVDWSAIQDKINEWGQLK